MALTTAANLRSAESGIPEDAATTTWLGEVIAAADEWIAEYCGYPPASAGAAPSIEETTYTTYVGEGLVEVTGDRRGLRFRVYPVITITSVHDDDDWEYGADELVASSDYVQDGTKGQRLLLKPDADHGAFTATPRAVKVVFSAGYDTVSGKLQQAATELALFLYRLNGRRGDQSVSDGQLVTTHRPEEMPKHVRQLLARYRLPGVFL